MSRPTNDRPDTTRRNLLRAIAAAPALSAGGLFVPAAYAAAPQYTFKFGNNLPASHPLNIRAQEAAERIAKESNGRLQLNIFPNNQLGGDTDMLAQVRSGGIDIFNSGTMVITTLAPISAITAMGFAFAKSDDVWAAVDGKLGNLIRASFAKVGLYTFEKMWDNGFRQVTTSTRPVRTADDLNDMKIRVPVSAMGISMFKSLGAAPTSLQFSEVYSALQTKIVDAQENPLAIVQTAKLNEVQKFCSMTNHSWDGYHMIVNGRSWRALPDDLKTIMARAFNDAGMQQREDLRKLNTSLQTQLTAAGMTFNDAAPDTFREKLRKAGFYTQWRDKFGPEAWAALEAVTGKVA